MSEDRVPNGGLVSDIPHDLKSLPQWVGWRIETRGGKATKVPVDPRTGRLASSTDSKTWGTFEEAFAGTVTQWDGVGFVFTADDPYCGIDLDDVINPATGELDPDAAKTVDRFASYAELSPSKTGVHIVIKGKLPPGGRKRGDRECYDAGRFFTVTGLRASQYGVEDRQHVLNVWHADTFPAPKEQREQLTRNAMAHPIRRTDQDLAQRILESKQGDKFDRLYSGDTSGYASGSEADLALCSILSFWTQGDSAAVDRLFRASGLMRPKWDASRGESTYGKLTVTKAVATGAKIDPTYKSGAEPPVVLGPVAAADGRIFRWMSELQKAEANEKWIWNGFISRGGVTLLSALWKAGKSTLLAHLVRAFDGSEPEFLGREIKPARVLYVSEEDAETWAERRDALKINDHVGVICRPFKGRASAEQWADLLAKICEAVRAHGFDLVVFDTMSKMWPVRDENNANQVEEALMGLWTITALGAGVLIVHHTRKSQGDNFTAARGSGGLSAFCETLIDFDRDKDAGKNSSRRVLFCGGRYRETPRKLRIELSTDGQRYSAIGGDDDEDEADEAPEDVAMKARVLNCLPTDPEEGVSLNYISEEAAPWVATAKRNKYMIGLANEGLAFKGESGYYRAASASAASHHSDTPREAPLGSSCSC